MLIWFKLYILPVGIWIWKLHKVSKFVVYIVLIWDFWQLSVKKNIL